MVSLLCTNSVLAQTDSTEGVSIDEQLAMLLGDLNSLYENIKKGKFRHGKTAARKLKFIGRKIDRAVKTVPPNSCLSRLKIAMKDFYELTSDVGTGIACGPPIIPTFFDRDKEPLTTDCLPPPEDEVLRAQLGDLFSEVYGLYNKARDLARTDTNLNEIPDICE